MTKKQQAQQIFNDLWFKGVKDRQTIIRRFIDVLDMTPAGAATYFANCKKEALPEVASAPFVARATPSILESNPVWKQAVIDKHNSVSALAEKLYNVDLSNVGIRFDLKGRAAGMACRRRSQYYVRYNSEACRKYTDEQVNGTVPHELAHIVCMMRPELGKNHDAGWKRVCRSLGGSDERCHTMQLTSGKACYRYEYNVNGEVILIGPKIHRQIQNGAVRISSKTRARVNHTHFVKKVQI